VAETSLRAHLLRRVGLVTGAMLLLDAAACYWTALHFANLVYDRWLLDDAQSLSRALLAEDGQVEFALGGAGLDVFRFDSTDTVYYRVRSAQRGLIAGDDQLPPEPVGIGAHPRVYDATVADQPVRVAALRIPIGADSVTITTAETLRKRETLAREILWAMALPQVALLLAALGMTWWSVSRSLHPLTQLAGELRERSYSSLSAVAEDGLPQEARVLVQRLNELLQRVDAVVRSQQSFLADAAHQLRTPLTAVMLHADRLGHAENAGEADAALAALRAAALRASRVGSQLLTLARTEAAVDAAAAQQQIDLGALARRTGEDWVPIAVQQSIDFGLEVPARPAWVRGHESLLADLISNLVDNAFRYGHRPGTVTLGVRQADEHVELYVADDGPGIPAPLRERVFERFFRAPGTSGDGCGLGLAIVHEIARRHGATLGVSGPPERTGSEFRVTFPR